MAKKLKKIPPGSYDMVILRSRKVRNKPLRRIHYRITGGEYDGLEGSYTIRQAEGGSW